MPEDGGVGLEPQLIEDHRPPANGEWVIRVLPGPQFSLPAPGKLLPGTFRVDPYSDRVGVRLRPLDPAPEAIVSPLREMNGIISEGVPRGAVQIPPSGELVILLADHQTTGGYPVGAVVASVDMWRVAQLRPGNHVRFETISLESAMHLLGAFHEQLREYRSAPAGEKIIAPAAEVMAEPGLEERLMRGFLEWSEEDVE